VIWLGCTSKRSANSTIVCSPLIASSATFALNAAPWFLLGLFAPFSFVQGQTAK